MKKLAAILIVGFLVAAVLIVHENKNTLYLGDKVYVSEGTMFSNNEPGESYQVYCFPPEGVYKIVEKFPVGGLGRESYSYYLVGSNFGGECNVGYTNGLNQLTLIERGK